MLSQPETPLLVGAAFCLLAATALAAQQTPADTSSNGAAQLRQPPPAGEERWRSPPDRWLERQPRPGSRAPTVKGYLEEMSFKVLPQGVVLIAGSATAWMWDEGKWFSDFRAVNRGFGGSRIDDNTYFADRLILPYRPSTIVLYAGDNDIWSGKPPERTGEDFDAFVRKIRKALPFTQIVFVSIRPSVARWSVWPQMQEANRLIRARIEADADLHYADIVPATLGPDGRPRPELFIADDLHMSELGYLEWTRVVKPIVAAAETRHRELEAQAAGSQPGSR